MIRMEVSHSTTTDKWIAERHYLKSTPAGAVLRLEFYDYANLIGAMSGEQINVNPKRISELSSQGKSLISQLHVLKTEEAALLIEELRQKLADLE